MQYIHVVMQKTCQQRDISDQEVSSCVHFMENCPSILRDMPWIKLQNSEVMWIIIVEGDVTHSIMY